MPPSMRLPERASSWNRQSRIVAALSLMVDIAAKANEDDLEPPSGAMEGEFEEARTVLA